MMKKFFLGAFVSVLCISNSFAQQVKCDALLSKKMGNVIIESDEITKNLATLLACGEYDELTKNYLSEDHNVMAVITRSTIPFEGNVEYSVLLNVVDSISQDVSFRAEMQHSVDIMRITKEPSTLAVFEANEAFFRELEPDEAIFEELREFYRNLGPTDMDIQASFRYFYMQRNSK